MAVEQTIEQIITLEKKYFEPMLKRQQEYSLEQLNAFRYETLSQRKERISKEVFEISKGIVSYGPFYGFKINKNPWWGNMDLGSMCLGLYEKEVLDFLFSSETINRNIFIDIGAADGYYGVGLLFAGRYNKSICFEISDKGRETISRNWENNNRPGQIEIYGDVFNDFDFVFNNVDTSRCVVLIDIEGAEFEFLTESKLESLKNAIIIIEIHNWVNDFLSRYVKLLEIANKYFHISFLTRVDKLTTEYEELRSFTDDNRLLLVSESRPCLMRFLKLSPKL